MNFATLTDQEGTKRPGMVRAATKAHSCREDADKPAGGDQAQECTCRVTERCQASRREPSSQAIRTRSEHVQDAANMAEMALSSGSLKKVSAN